MPQGKSLGPILVATDLSDPARHALREAGLRAQQRRCKLVVLHVALNPMAIHPVFPQLSQRDVDDEIRLGRELTDYVISQVAEIIDSSIEVQSVVEFGVPYAAIVRAAEDLDAQLIVVGSRGSTGLGRLLLGGVAERVVRYAHGPVLVVRPTARSGTVLAATDLSDPSLPAVEAAARASREQNLKLTLIHVVELPAQLMSGFSPLGPVPAVPDGEAIAEVKEAAKVLLRDLLVRFGVEGNVEVMTHHRAAAAIVAKADEIGAELVVVGTHGRTGLARMTLGSIAEQVVGRAHCSVLAVRLNR